MLEAVGRRLSLREVYSATDRITGSLPFLGEDARLRTSFRERLQTLLNGQPHKTFHIPEPVFSGLVWLYPTTIDVAETPRGYELSITAHNDTPGSNRSYGTQIEMLGGTLAVHEIINGNRKKEEYTFHDGIRGVLRAANNYADIAVMATSSDPEIQARYRKIRQTEHDHWRQLTSIDVSPESLRNLRGMRFWDYIPGQA